jgi:hypothetical protein
MAGTPKAKSQENMTTFEVAGINPNDFQEAFATYITKINRELVNESWGHFFKRQFGYVSGKTGRDHAQEFLNKVENNNSLRNTFKALGELSWGSASMTIIRNTLSTMLSDSGNVWLEKIDNNYLMDMIREMGKSEQEITPANISKVFAAANTAVEQLYHRQNNAAVAFG